MRTLRRWFAVATLMLACGGAPFRHSYGIPGDKPISGKWLPIEVYNDLRVYELSQEILEIRNARNELFRRIEAAPSGEVERLRSLFLQTIVRLSVLVGRMSKESGEPPAAVSQRYHLHTLTP